MRTIVNYIRSLFCKHEWHVVARITDTVDGIAVGYRIVYRCRKCGFVQEVKL